VLAESLKRGLLKVGDTVVEASSGNAGAAIANAAKALGLRCRIFVPESISITKVEKIQSYGADVTKMDASAATGAEILAARQLGSQPGHFFFNQFENPLCAPAYRNSLGPELVRQLLAASVVPTTFIAGVGTGSSILGVGSALRAAFDSPIQIIAVAPDCSPTDIEGLHPGHLRPEGWFAPWRTRQQNFEQKMVFVSNEDAYRTSARLKAETGHSVGPATGAYLYVASTEVQDGIVILLGSDGGEKYRVKAAKYT
jgi:cysteine synthase A